MRFETAILTCSASGSVGTCRTFLITINISQSKDFWRSSDLLMRFETAILTCSASGSVGMWRTFLITINSLSINRLLKKQWFINEIWDCHTNLLSFRICGYMKNIPDHNQYLSINRLLKEQWFINEIWDCHTYLLSFRICGYMKNIPDHNQ